MARTLTTASTLQCPHGGSVTIVSANATITADGAGIVTIADTFTIAGCAFTLPGPKPSPCVRVQWVVSDLSTRVDQVPTLSESSVGLCFSADSIPQGPVSVVNTQAKVSTR